LAPADLWDSSRVRRAWPKVARIGRAPSMELESNDGPVDLVARAALATAADGSEPFVWWRWLGVKVDPHTLLPESVDLLRSSTCQDWVCVLGRGRGFHICIDSRSGDTRLTVTANTPSLAESVGRSICALVPTPQVSSRSSALDVRFWFGGRESLSSTTRSVALPVWDEIRSNYTARTADAVGRLMDLESHALEAQHGGRLVIWHGPPGTGRTSAVRGLLEAWQDWCEPQYLCDVEQILDRPEYLFEVVLSPARETAWKVVVADDVDRSEIVGGRKPGLERLLDVSDGLLGQSAQTVVVITMNGDPGRLHPALLRPGRCLSLVGFEQFNRCEAERWLGVPPGDSRDRFSLADLYALRGDVPPTRTARRSAVGQYL